MASTGVQVVVRLRPLNEREKKHGTLPVISASTEQKVVTVIKGTGGRQARSQYAFDNVFTAFSTQEEVFSTTLKPVIKDVLQGFESTVFAYGQTGTGKTHTMEGSLDHPGNYGVIPRSAEAIFVELNREDLNYEGFKVYCSYLEIYNEDLCDLLTESQGLLAASRSSPAKKAGTQKLEIMEGKNGPFCRGLSEREVHNAEDLLELMQKAQQQRKVGETNMNKQSSRSHCIFTLRVEAKRRLADGALFETRGKLHMVDLAGSECAKTANMDDAKCGGSKQAARERERMNINRSLLTLGRVVKLLKEQSTKKQPGNVRIPYRDSKLTRILQQALGGNSKTVIVGTLSPSVTAIEESISTLNYAQAAHGIINKPVSASYLSEATKSSSILSGMETSSTGPQTLEHWKEMEVRLEYMKCQVEEAKAALARKHLQQQELVDRCDKAEAERTVLEDQLVAAQQKSDTLQAELVAAEEKQFQTEKELGETKAQLEKTALVLQATQQTEDSLTVEALALIGALKESTLDCEKLYGMVVANRDADVERRQAAKHFNGAIAALLMDVKQALNALTEEKLNFQKKSADLADIAVSKDTSFLEKTKEILRNAVSAVDEAVTTLKSSIEEKGGIVPTADLVAKDTFLKVGNTWSLLESSEQKLIAQFNETRGRLMQFGNHLNELENSYWESSEQTLSTLESTVATSKRKLEDLVSSTITALEEGGEARKKVRDATRDNVEQWKLSMIQSGDLILKQSAHQRARVEENESMLTSEMQRHANIETSLNKQGSLIRGSHEMSVSTHQAQNGLLLQTKAAMDAAHNKQSQLLNTFVQRLMKDVTSLVETQVSQVIQEVNSGHTTFSGQSAALMKNHSSITASTLEALAKAGELTSSIQSEAEIAKVNNNKVISHLADTKLVFADLETAANNHNTNVGTFAMRTMSKLRESEDLENVHTKVREKLRRNGSECVSFMSGDLLHDTADGLANQNKVGKSIVAFTKNDVLEIATSSLNEMETPRSDIMAAFARECSGLEECIEQGLMQIKEKASVSSRMACELHGSIQAINSKFVDTTAKERSSEIVQTKATILEQSTEHAESTTRSIAIAEDGSTKAVCSAENFVRMNLSAFVDVPVAPNKVKIKYTEKLSKTPHEKEILGKRNATSVLKVLSSNQDNLKSTTNKNLPSACAVPHFAHERNEPCSKHLP